MKLFYFDVETTGVNPKENAIHQLSGAIEINGEIVEQFDFKIKPYEGCKIEQAALEVGGVTIEQISNYPTAKSVYSEFVKMLSKYVDKFNKKDKFFLVGYNNAAFDNQFLRAFFEQNNDRYFGSWFYPNCLDVYVLATQKLLSERPFMENFKLMTVAKTMGIEIDESMLHNALYDIELTRQIYYLCTN